MPQDFLHAQLLREHPEIVSIAPRLKLDDQGQLTNDAVIAIGVKKINPLRFGPGAAPSIQPAPIPNSLPAITHQGIEDPKQFVEVVIEDEGEIVLESFTAKRRPCGGMETVDNQRLTV